LKENRKARSLELFFIDGDPNGMLTATIPFQWTGHVLVTSRTQLKDALKREEASRPGVYILIGENYDGSLIYIGESDDIGRRIKEHDSKKDWWATAIFVTSSGEQLNKAHIRYLESLLVDKARQVNKIALDNGNMPTQSKLNEAAEAHMQDFLENIFLVLPALKFDFFSPNTRTTERLESANANSELPFFVLETPKHRLKARATIEDSHFIVLEGSKAKLEWSPNTAKQGSYGKLFDELVEQGVLVVDGKTRVFAQNYEFNSPSAAAAVINGRPTSGPKAWKVEGSSKTYGEWEEEELKK
jgi:hypothetical protein